MQQTLLDKKFFSKYENQQNIDYEKSNFRFAFYALKKEQRIAISSIYAFCNYIDNIIDNADNSNPQLIFEKQNRLDWWQNVLADIYNHKNDDRIAPFARIIYNYQIPQEYFISLITGIGKDLIKHTYKTINELLEYCYGVASVVGLICLHIFGDTSENAKQYAINLGYALQLTNIIRDMRFDSERNYIYIPHEDFERFNYKTSDLKKSVYNDNFINLMKFQYNRAIKYYEIANNFLSKCDKKKLISAEIMEQIYFELLKKIHKSNYDIFSKKIRISDTKKLTIAVRKYLYRACAT